MKNLPVQPYRTSQKLLDAVADAMLSEGDLATIRGAKSMLRESAKHFRCLQGPEGHAAMADMHADGLDQVIRNADK